MINDFVRLSAFRAEIDAIFSPIENDISVVVIGAKYRIILRINLLARIASLSVSLACFLSVGTDPQLIG